MNIPVIRVVQRITPGSNLSPQVWSPAHLGSKTFKNIRIEDSSGPFHLLLSAHTIYFTLRPCEVFCFQNELGFNASFDFFWYDAFSCQRKARRRGGFIPNSVLGRSSITPYPVSIYTILYFIFNEKWLMKFKKAEISKDTHNEWNSVSYSLIYHRQKKQVSTNVYCYEFVYKCVKICVK